MKHQLLLGAALLLSTSPQWASTQPTKTTGTAEIDQKSLKVFDSDKPESKGSISKDIHNDGTVKGPVLQKEEEREEEVFDEVDNQDGIDAMDNGNGSTTNPEIYPKRSR